MNKKGAYELGLALVFILMMIAIIFAAYASMLENQKLNEACIKLGYESYEVMNAENYCMKGNGEAQRVFIDCPGFWGCGFGDITVKPLILYDYRSRG